MYALKIGIQPEVVFPAWCHKDNDLKKDLNVNLPLQLGEWSGQETKSDPAIFNATGAKVAVDRIYTDNSGHKFTLHVAYYDDVEAGVWHSPLTCYPAHGWHSDSQLKQRLAVDTSPQPEVLLTQWHQEDQPLNCLVVHWYSLGDTILYERLGLGAARFNLRGSPTWPPLVKILIQNQNNSVNDIDKESILSFAKQVYLWLDGISHEKRVPSKTPAKAAAEKSSKTAETKTPAKAEKSK